ncbi:MAG: hypothetical protein Q9162_002094 [Coniocarpon cinnabarinum]
METQPLVLITGANGFLGFAVVAWALKSQFRVRAVVRRQNAADQVARAPSSQPYIYSGALSFAVIPDNTKLDAYHKAARGCTFIIHTASPLPTVPGDLVEPALAGTRAILSAAKHNKAVQRVVFTSSTSSLRTFQRLLLQHPDNQAMLQGRSHEVMTMTADSKVPTQLPVPESTCGFHRYVNSKIAAANLVHAYSETSEFRTSHFSIVNIMPGWVLGPEELTTTKRDAFKGSNLILGWLFMPVKLNPFLDLPDAEEAPLLAESVHLDDVAEGHVNALNVDKVKGKYRNFLLCSDGPNGPEWNDAAGIVRRELSEEVAQGKIPFIGQLGAIKSKFDATPAEKDLLGHRFIPFEKQVVDTIRYYLHLPD